MRQIWLIMVVTVVSFILSACSAPNNTSTETLPGHRSRIENAGKRLAISHGFTLRMLNRDVEGVQTKHLEECRKLACTVLSISVDRSYEEQISARFSARIAPEAFETFAKIIAEPPAQVIMHVEQAEDETLPLLDAEKRLEIKLALRDRLTAMLREPGQKSASDLALIEKEIAAAQGDIEAFTAQRDHLRTITETLEVAITYKGIEARAGGLNLSPIDRAIKRMGETLVVSIAGLIWFTVTILVWIPLIALIIWIIRWSFMRRKSA